MVPFIWTLFKIRSLLNGKYLQAQEIIVYCTNTRRANLISETLKELHFGGEITVISDGITGWISAGFKTVGMSDFDSSTGTIFQK